MKCLFDKPLRADDKVILNLYKRVYPKWTFRELRSGLGSTLAAARETNGACEGEAAAMEA